MNVLSIDIGYGFVKYCISNGTDFNIGKFVSGVCEVPTENTFSEISSNVYHHFDNKRYFLFDLATKLNVEPINIMKYEGYKEAAPVIISYLLTKFNMNNITKVAIGLSPAVWGHKDDFKEYVTHKLKFTDDLISIHLQGISGHEAYYKFGLDIENFKDNLDVRSTNYIGIDMGFNTLDFYNCIDGEVLDYGIRGLLGKGVCIITDNIKKYITETFGIAINDIEAKSILSTMSYKRRGTSHDMKSKIELFVYEYLVSTIDLIEDEYGVQINRCDNILLFGGGAEVIKNTLLVSDKLKEKLDTLYGGEFLLLPKINSEYYNSVGYCLSALKIK